ncbi:translocation and assembly module lipoprotein TamL [Capnocytophaga sp.]
MRNTRSPLSLIGMLLVLAVALSACDATKRVPKDRHLLRENLVYVNGTKTDDAKINNFVLQKPNSYILGMPISLYIYNLGNPNAEKDFAQWIDTHPRWHRFLKGLLSEKQVGRLQKSFLVSGIDHQLQRIGEAPAVLDTARVHKSAKQLGAYFRSIGYFNNKVTDSIFPLPKEEKQQAKVGYYITTGERYYLDSLKTKITSPEIDSVYQLHKSKTFLKSGAPYQLSDFSNERSRLYELFRNNGFYTFQQSSINFQIVRDTVAAQKDTKLQVTTDIGDLIERDGDVITTKKYKVHHINKIRLYTDYDSKVDKSTLDSLQYRDMLIYYKGKLRYRPRVLYHATGLRKGAVYSDMERGNTYRQFNNLRVFRYPNMEFKYAANDTLQNKLDANIYLSSMDRFSLRLTNEIKRSEIEAIGFGIGTSFAARNLFRGAETLELNLQGTFASQPTLKDTRFFNTSEVSGDIRLIFPSIVFPLNTRKLIPYYMTPQTILQGGMSYQTNIGLDKRTTSGLLRYVWNPHNQKNKVIFDLINVQYVNNINPGNFFNIYQSTYEKLNDIARKYSLGSQYVDGRGNLTPSEGTFKFLEDIFNRTITVQPDDVLPLFGILERYNRITNNDFIVASSFTYIINSKSQFFERNFSQLRFRIEGAGSLLNALTATYKVVNTEGSTKNKLFGVEYAQYAKAEVDFIKHFPIGKQSSLAFRSFLGVAIPYGNSDNIPFSQSYFAGGTTDNRGWKAYRLGPGSSQSILDYNEANMKITLNLEYRFPILGALKGALFTDVGNIWNVADNTPFEENKFKDLSSLKDVGLSIGLGLRYDFNFFVIRLDMGIPTYDPAEPIGDRWIKKFRIKETVFNFGINYPF